MKYQLAKKKAQAEITFELTAEEWNDAVEKAYNKTKGKYNIPGFRRGKVPRKIIERNYGPAVFFDDAFNEFFPDAYSKVLDENEDIYPVDRPDVKWDDISDKGVKFVATVTLKPEVALGEYKGIKLKKIVHNVTGKDVDAEINNARQRAGRKVNVADRAAQMDDFVIIDYCGAVNGVKFEGGTAEKQELHLGSKQFIPGFEEGVVGMKVGDSKLIEVKFPADYHSKDLADKLAGFTVTLHEIKVLELPNLDDEFAKDVSQFDTLKDYKDDVKKKLTETAKRKSDSENESALIEKIVKNVKVEIPDCMIETHTNYMLEEFGMRLMYQGMKLDDYFKYTGSSEAEFRKAKKEQATNEVKMRLTLEAIVKAEKIKATDKDVDAKIAELAKSVNKTTEEFKEGTPPDRIEYFKNEIVMNKVFGLLKDNAVWE
ncbi:MAG: trigger factor [Firmicutes bacterium]|nr:trigger factor [Bacillota bacterium]